MTRVSGSGKATRGWSVALGVVAGMAVMVAGWFRLPYSPLRRRFQRDVAALIATEQIDDGVLTADDVAGLPEVVQRFLAKSGHIGLPRASYVRTDLSDVAFTQVRGGRTLAMDYTQYNFAAQPARLAFMNTGMFGVPFQGYDFYHDGRGEMTGVLGKAVTLFDQTGPDMDRAGLVTVLAEAMFCPASLLRGYITLTQLDDYHMRGTIVWQGVTVSGEFTFNDADELVAFTSEDRAAVSSDGTVEHVPWSERFSDYQPMVDGVRFPSRMQAVWEYPDDPLVYFDGTVTDVSYGH